MSTHEIVWTFDQDKVAAEVICSAPPLADCNITCLLGCESWAEVLRDDDGRPYHEVSGDDEEQIRHDMQAMGDDECNVVLFLNDHPPSLPELGRGTFEIGRTPIEPEFNGDAYEWRKA